MVNGDTVKNGHKLSGFQSLKAYQTQKYSKEKFSPQILAKVIWETATFWLLWQLWLKDLTEFSNFSCSMKSTNKGITQSKFYIKVNGLPLIWMNTYLSFTENQHSLKPKTINFGWYCSKKLGLSFTLHTRELKQDTLKKDFTT